VKVELFFGRPRSTLWLGVGFLALFALLGLLVPSDPLALEQRWLEWMRDIRTPTLDHLAHVFNWLGRGIGRAFVLVAAGVPLIVRRRWEALVAFALTEAVTPTISSIVKALVGRPRPPDGLVHPSGSSFPSGHVSFAATTLVAVVVLYTAPGPRRALWWSLAVLGTAVMAWSRTYLQVHWLLDVIGGSLLGAGVALVVFAAAQMLVAAPAQRSPG
jgi:undecaprenyl-diphosphatase